MAAGVVEAEERGESVTDSAQGADLSESTSDGLRKPAANAPGARTLLGLLAARSVRADLAVARARESIGLPGAEAPAV